MEDEVPLPLVHRATLLWSSEETFGTEIAELRRDFDHLEEALRFLKRETALSHWHTAWLISSNRLVPPDDVRDMLTRIPT